MNKGNGKIKILNLKWKKENANLKWVNEKKNFENENKWENENRNLKMEISNGKQTITNFTFGSKPICKANTFVSVQVINS